MLQKRREPVTAFKVRTVLLHYNNDSKSVVFEPLNTNVSIYPAFTVVCDICGICHRQQNLLHATEKFEMTVLGLTDSEFFSVQCFQMMAYNFTCHVLLMLTKLSDIWQVFCLLHIFFLQKEKLYCIFDYTYKLHITNLCSLQHCYAIHWHLLLIEFSTF